MRGTILCVAAALIAGLPAFGDVITVDDDRVQSPSADYTTIQAAVNNSVDGDEIIVYPGTYTEAIDLRNRKVTIRSVNPDDAGVVAATVVQSPGAAFTADGTESLDTVIDGLTIFRGGTAFRAENGAGITIRRCVIDDNRQNNARAIFLSNAGTVLIDRVILTNAQASSSPNAALAILDCIDGVTVVDSSIVGNAGQGVLIQQSSSVIFERCVIQENRGKQSGTGGGMEVQDSTNITINDCVFSLNRARADTAFSLSSVGGALYINNSAVTIDRCLFYGNRAENRGSGLAKARGGAISVDNFADPPQVVHVRNSVFVGNIAAARGTGNQARGGAVFVDTVGTANIVGCTFSDNQCETDTTTASLVQGGAVWMGGSGATSARTIANGVFRRNREIRSNGNTTGHLDGSLTSRNNFTSGNPMLVRNPDDFNGTWDINDDYGDLRLQPGSPAINGGDNSFVTTALDHDGNTRIRGGLVDQGAYESPFARYFVDQSVSSSGNGTSWDDAVQTLAELPFDGNEAEVRIAEGTYVVPAGGFELGTGAWIRGGYNPGGGELDPVSNPVVITGDQFGDDLPGGMNRADNAEHVLWAQDASDIIIDGVTITGGNAAGSGGGVSLVNVEDVDLLNITIEENDADTGGGLAASNADGLALNNVTLRNNRGLLGDGGLVIDGGSSVTIDNSLLTGNLTPEQVGAARMQGGSSVIVKDTAFTDNSAGLNIGAIEVTGAGTYVEFLNTEMLRNSANGTVGAIRYADGSSGFIDQSVIAENDSLNGGIVRIRDDAALLVRQSTIARNTSVNSAGIWQNDIATITVTNSIVHSNIGSEVGSALESQLRGDIVLDYSLIEGWDGSFAGMGSIDGDPVFVDAMNSDYRIDANSSAIDAGDTNTIVDASDLDGNPRVVDDTGITDTGIGGPPTIDIGAYEFQGTSGPTPCSDADLASPLGQLNFFDLGEFLTRFNAQDPSVDFAAPFGVFNFFDLGEFLTLFNQGCP